MAPVPLKEHLESKIDSTNELLTLRIDALENATQVAKSEMDHRLESMNEFRSQLKEQASQFITRTEHDTLIREIRTIQDQLPHMITRAEHAAVQEDVRILRESRAELAGKASQQSVISATLLGAGGLLLGVISLMIEILKVLK